ncbi:unnamed protein product [Brassica oleracea]
MGSANSENNYNSDESIGSCEGNSSHTDPTIYFRNLDLQYFVEEPLTMLNRITTSRGYFNTYSTANLSKDSTIFVNLQMETLTTIHIFMVY